MTRESGSKVPIIERTSVAGKIRRIARFDKTVVKAAIDANAPTQIVLNHIDYVDVNRKQLEGHSDRTFRFASRVEISLDVTLDYFGFGPSSLVPARDAIAIAERNLKFA